MLYADQRKYVNHVPINTPAVNWTSDWSFLKAVSTKFGRLKPLNPQDEKISTEYSERKKIEQTTYVNSFARRLEDGGVVVKY